MVQKLTTEQFVERARRVHGGRYGYGQVRYVRNSSEVAIVCPEHGLFRQTPAGHLRGGCLHCGTRKRARTRSSAGAASFVADARKVHGDRYGYDAVRFVTGGTDVRISCAEHGEFLQSPISHLRGAGCPACALRSRGLKRRSFAGAFIAAARRRHGERYGYDLVRYVDCDAKVAIRCPAHGVFEQSPDAHRRGQGCPMCRGRVSKRCTAWLDSLGVPEREANLRIPGRPGEVDGYDPAKRTVYQFHGDYYHGNPAVYAPHAFNARMKLTFGELHERTLRRDQAIRDAGYELVVMWEKDWQVAAK